MQFHFIQSVSPAGGRGREGVFLLLVFLSALAIWEKINIKKERGEGGGGGGRFIYQAGRQTGRFLVNR